MAYTKVAQTKEIPSGSKLKVTIDSNDILLVNVEGKYFAVDNKCPHMGGSLYNGRLDGPNIVCPRHGTVFDVRTGNVTQAGKLLFMNVRVSDLKCYSVKLEGTDILIEL